MRSKPPPSPPRYPRRNQCRSRWCGSAVPLGDPGLGRRSPRKCSRGRGGRPLPSIGSLHSRRFIGYRVAGRDSVGGRRLAEAAQESAFADLDRVRGLADVLHESSDIARRGAETLDCAKRSVLAAVNEADSAGYMVGEDLSVTPPRGSVAAAAQAQLYAAAIQDRAAQLVAHDAGNRGQDHRRERTSEWGQFRRTARLARSAGARRRFQAEPRLGTVHRSTLRMDPLSRSHLGDHSSIQTGTVEGGGGFPPLGGKGGSGAGGKGGAGGGAEPPRQAQGGPPVPAPRPSRFGKVPLQTDRRQIESKYKHAEDFGDHGSSRKCRVQ